MDNRADLQGISSRLKQSRHKMGLTPGQVFKQTGISTGNLSELENGKYPPSAKTLIMLSELYGISTDWILKGANYTIGNVMSVSKDSPFLIPNKEMMRFFEKLVKMWADGDRDIRGWIVVQMRLAFPKIAEELKKEQKEADTT